jgi:hypothetical protein
MNVEMKQEPVETDHLEQEIKEEEEVSDEEVELKSTQKPSASLFTMTKSKDQVLTNGDVHQDADMR